METKQLSLDKVYEIVKKIQIELEDIKGMIKDRIIEISTEDLEFARKTEEAYRRLEAGDFIEMDSEDFLKEKFAKIEKHRFDA